LINFIFSGIFWQGLIGEAIEKVDGSCFNNVSRQYLSFVYVYEKRTPQMGTAFYVLDKILKSVV
jgi:hypothetical protein